MQTHSYLLPSATLTKLKNTIRVLPYLAIMGMIWGYLAAAVSGVIIGLLIAAAASIIIGTQAKWSAIAHKAVRSTCVLNHPQK